MSLDLILGIMSFSFDSCTILGTLLLHHPYYTTESISFQTLMLVLFLLTAQNAHPLLCYSALARRNSNNVPEIIQGD